MKVKGIYQYSRIRQYPNDRQIRVDVGSTNGKELSIYSFYEKGQMTFKLFYLTKEKIGKWIKSKLNCYENGIKTKVLDSESKLT